MKALSFRITDETADEFKKIHQEADSNIRLKQSDIARIIFERGIKDVQKHGIVALTNPSQSKSR